jgi:biopolymer transport protein ExbD/biopolymer transport protein TolR
VDLPVAVAAVVMEDANKEDSTVVAVTRDGKTFLGGDQVQIDDLGAKITARMEANKQGSKSVFLRADNRANYGKVMDTVDAIRSAGVSSLVMLTEKKDQ